MRTSRPALLGLVLVTVCTPHVAAASAKPGKILVSCVVRGATIELDGSIVGQAPLDSPLLVRPGRHRLRVFKRGYRNSEHNLSVGSGQTIEVEADPIPSAAILRLVGELSGATILLGGEELGVGPIDQIMDQLGARELRVQKPGYRTFSAEILLLAGEETVVHVNLIPLPGKENRTASTPLVKKWWFWTIVGVAVAGTVGTVLGVVYGGRTERAAPTPDAVLRWR